MQTLISLISLLLILIITSFSSLNAQSYTSVKKVVANDRGSLDLFGHSVDVSNLELIAGAYIEDEDENGFNPLSEAGSVYFFKRDNTGNWVQTQKVVASDRDYDDRFGWSVAIENDWAVVGAILEDNDENGLNYVQDAGSVYILKRNPSGIWEQHQKLVASDRESGDFFGSSVAISGNYIAVGAYLEDEDENQSNAIAQAGSVYLFEKNHLDNWTEVKKVIAPNRSVDDLFGFSVSLYNNRLLVGAKLEDHDQNENTYRKNAGSAYIYKKDNWGNWNLEQKLVPADRSPYDEFGYSVNIYKDNIIIGAYEEDEDEFGLNTQSGAGSAYIYELNAQNEWVQKQKLIGTNRTPDDHFGVSVSVGDNYCVVGAFEEDYDENGNALLSDAGAAFVYERNTSGSWLLIEKIVAFDRGLHDNFGFSVSLDNNIIAVGAEKEDEDLNSSNSLTNSGSAYVFEYPSFVGLNNDQSPLTVNLYPTPFSDILFIETSDYYNSQLVVRIYNVLGEEVFNNNYVGMSELKIDLQHLHEGIYIIQLDNGSKKYNTRVIKANH